jgi:urease accessory protein
VLSHAYAEPPLRVGRLYEADGFVQLVIVCSGPGIFAGDRLAQHVRVERGARVQLVSQSALQVHPSAAEGPATIDAAYEVDDDGELDCFWDPVIPFAGSRMRQRIGIRLAEGGRLLWSDALMAGRVGRGEAWQFETLDHELRLNVAGALTYLERYGLDPASRAASHAWVAGRSLYMGTTVVYDEEATSVRAEAAQAALNTVDDVRAGVDSVANRLIVSRLLAERGPAFARARLLLRDAFAHHPLRR